LRSRANGKTRKRKKEDQTMENALQFDHLPFRWTTGIEGSMIAQLGVDQWDWTQHNRFWLQDFALAANDLRAGWVRYFNPRAHR
jgi:hypothetical protein